MCLGARFAHAVDERRRVCVRVHVQYLYCTGTSEHRNTKKWIWNNVTITIPGPRFWGLGTTWKHCKVPTHAGGATMHARKHARADAHSYKQIDTRTHDTNKSKQSTGMHRLVYLRIFGSYSQCSLLPCCQILAMVRVQMYIPSFGITLNLPNTI